MRSKPTGCNLIDTYFTKDPRDPVSNPQYPVSKVLQVPQIMRKLEAGKIVVTSTRHLARHVLDLYARHMAEQGMNTWPTPISQSWEDWMVSVWRKRTTFDPQMGKLTLLDDVQESQLWQQVVDRTEIRGSESVFLQTPSTAKAAQNTWRLLHDWCIPVESLQASAIEDTQVFCTWVEEFRNTTDRYGWKCPCELPGLLASMLDQGKLKSTRDLMFLGFDEWLPAQLRLLEALAAAGVEFEHLALPDVNECTYTVACDDRHEEFEAAAQWSRQLLMNQTNGSIGVIIEDLAETRDQVDRVFDRVLHQGLSLDQNTDRKKAYHISLGRPLLEFPVVTTAAVLLRYLRAARPFPDTSYLLHSPHIAGGMSEVSARANLDLDIRTQGWETVSLNGIKKRAQAMANPPTLLIECLINASEFTFERVQSPASWVETLIEWLSIFGWPGERALNSEEFQTVQAWQDVLGGLARLNMFIEVLDIGAVLNCIEHMLREKVFQTRSDPTPIQILGAGQAKGMQFEHLWISGMSDDCWPRAIHPNPFIPLALQRKFKLPAANPEIALARYEVTTSRLLASGMSVMVSFPLRKESAEVELSALYHAIGASKPVQTMPGMSEVIRKGAPKLDCLRDDYGPKLLGQSVRGGATILKDQAACPFRAFARHRLGASTIPDPQAALDPLERGTLVHECLAGFWQEIKSSRVLTALSQEQIERVLWKHIKLQINRLQQREINTFKNAVLEVEGKRLLELLLEWLEHESSRPAFEVSAIEQKTGLTLADLNFSLRIDRIDQLENGQELVVDYKTGRDVNVSHWFGDRPQEPQLPSYLISDMEKFDGMAFAHVVWGSKGYKGLSGGNEFGPGIKADTSWRESKRKWASVLINLAAQYKSGSAPVDPRDESVCRVCDLTSFCRVFETVSEDRGSD